MLWGLAYTAHIAYTSSTSFFALSKYNDNTIIINNIVITIMII